MLYGQIKLASVFKDFEIDQPKGSTREFDLKGYPLKSVTYPTDYGFVNGYKTQDDAELDMFRGTGRNHGEFNVWRPDIKTHPSEETKFFANLTRDERSQVLDAYKPVLRGSTRHASAGALLQAMARFKNQ